MSAFVSARVDEVIAGLGTDNVHVWRLPYVRGHGRAPLLRLLAAYLRVDVATLRMVDGVHGRPGLVGHDELDFNWSHSGDRALVALARNLPELGVDIERYRQRTRALELARRFFDADEAAWLQGLPLARQARAFLDLWTAKEAVLKAIGRGLGYGLERVSFVERSGRLLAGRFVGPAGPVEQWQVQALPLAPAWCGALAWRGAARPVGLFCALDGDPVQKASPD